MDDQIFDLPAQGIATGQLDPKKIAKRNKLIQLARSVLDDPAHREELSTLMRKLRLTTDDIIRAFVYYNFDIYAYSNEVYQSLAIRMVLHIHNLLHGSWHQERQQTVLKFLEIAAPNNLIEIGFGEPSQYVEHVIEKQLFHVTLCDFDESAFKFAEALLEIWNPAWDKMISFKNADMEDGEFIGPYDLYMFQDSIEHVTKPTDYLLKQVELSPPNAQFILGLPIGSPIPCHYKTWYTIEEAIEWLTTCGLRVKKSHLIKPNPDVDIFADRLDFNTINFFVLCDKINA